MSIRIEFVVVGTSVFISVGSVLNGHTVKHVAVVLYDGKAQKSLLGQGSTILVLVKSWRACQVSLCFSEI